MDGSEFLDFLAQSSKSVATRHSTKSAMGPMILICLIFTPSCVFGAYMLREDAFLRNLFGVASVVPGIVACAMYVYFAIWKTSRLQSENYQIRQEILQMVSKKGSKIELVPLSLPAIANPTPEEIEQWRDQQ